MMETKFMNDLKKNWNNYDLRYLNPIDRRMTALKEVEGMNTENVRFLINYLVKNYAKNGTYLEVGSFRGASLCSAAYKNHSTKCIGIDNFSVWDKDGTNMSILNENIKPYANIKFFESDYVDFFKKKLKLETVDVYFYDGDHKLGAQYEGLLNILPFLKKKCIIIVDDTNWERVSLANKSFLEMHTDFELLLDIKTPGNGHASWWNGIQVMGRNIK